MVVPYRKIKEGEMIWSSFFGEWIKVLKIYEDGYFAFMKKGVIMKSHMSIKHFQDMESTQTN